MCCMLSGLTAYLSYIIASRSEPNARARALEAREPQTHNIHAHTQPIDDDDVAAVFASFARRRVHSTLAVDLMMPGVTWRPPSPLPPHTFPANRIPVNSANAQLKLQPPLSYRPPACAVIKAHISARIENTHSISLTTIGPPTLACMHSLKLCRASCGVRLVVYLLSACRVCGVCPHTHHTTPKARCNRA